MKDNTNVEEEQLTEEKTEAVSDDKTDETHLEKGVEKKKSSAGIILCFVIIALLIVAIICILVSQNKKGETTKTGNEKKGYLSEYRMSGNALENFDLYFMQLENNGKNKVYSPLSIKYALGMLSDGAQGESKKQIDAVIGDYKPKAYPNNEHMSFANAMFIRNSIKDDVKSSYTDLIKSKYNAEVVYDDFNTPDAMNDWISSKTLKLIENLVDQDTVDNHQFFLINALAIDMNWVNLIQCAPTSTNLPCKHYGVHYIHEKYSDYVPEIYSNDDYPAMTFNGKDNIKSVTIGASFNNYDIVKELGEENIRKTVGEDYKEFLAKGGCGNDLDVESYLNKYIEEINSNYHQEDSSTDFYLYDDDSVKMFAKDLREYDGMTLQYVGIMPKNDSLQDFIQNTDAKKISTLVGSLKELKYSNFKEGVITKVKGSIPLFNYEYELDLESDLKSLGIEDIFDSSKINIKNLLNKTPDDMVISAAHKANIEFSNEGIRAAAVTMLGGGGAAGCSYNYDYEVPVEEIDLTFDKPYMYIIRDKATGEVWFVGTVYEPTVK